MKLSEKYFLKMRSPSGKGGIDNEIKLYGRICRLEGLLELSKEYCLEIKVGGLLIDKYINELNEITKREKL